MFKVLEALFLNWVSFLPFKSLSSSFSFSTSFCDTACRILVCNVSILKTFFWTVSMSDVMDCKGWKISETIFLAFNLQVFHKMNEKHCLILPWLVYWIILQLLLFWKNSKLHTQFRSCVFTEFWKSREWFWR